MRLIILLTFFAILLNEGSCLRCNKCTACESNSAQVETCRNVDPNVETAGCLTQIAKASESRNMTRKLCVYVPKNSQFECETFPNFSPLVCNVCSDKDFCNSASTITAKFTSILTVLIFVCMF